MLSINGIKSMIRFVIDVCNDAERLIRFLETNEFVLFQIYDQMKVFMASWLGKIYEVDKIDQVFLDKIVKTSSLKQTQDIVLPSSITKHESKDKVIVMMKEGMKKHVQRLITYLLENSTPHEFYHLVSYLKPSIHS